MNLESFKNTGKPQHFLKAGAVFVALNPTIISTILGSCISVCLFDKKLHYGGMNHFIFPSIDKENKALATAKYGNIAIEILIQTFYHHGSKKENLVASIVGGAFIKSSDLSLGASKKNIISAKKELQKFEVKIISEDTGGNKGRRLFFLSNENKLIIQEVNKDLHF